MKRKPVREKIETSKAEKANERIKGKTMLEMTDTAINTSVSVDSGEPVTSPEVVTPASTPVEVDASPVAVAAAKANKKDKRGRPPVVGVDKFRFVWQNAATLDDVIKTLGSLQAKGKDHAIFAGKTEDQAKLYVSMRASALRKKGMPLKTFPRGRKPSTSV